jgi:hypothetical protein
VRVFRLHRAFCGSQPTTELHRRNVLISAAECSILLKGAQTGRSSGVVGQLPTLDHYLRTAVYDLAGNLQAVTLPNGLTSGGNCTL